MGVDMSDSEVSDKFQKTVNKINRETSMNNKRSYAEVSKCNVQRLTSGKHFK